MMRDHSFTTLSVSEANHVLTVTLNRPQVRNAINFAMMSELLQLWQYVNTEQHQIRCIILTGQGEKAFCAGADLKERLGLDLETWRRQHIVFEAAMLAMLDCTVPIIAAVNGAAYGGGLELALASDFIYAATTATFAQSETKLGLMPGAMGTQNLPRACGLRRAKELSFCASGFDAQQGYQWNIVNKLCAPDRLMPEVLATAELICGNAPIAVQQAKKALNMSQQTDLRTGYLYEVEAYQRLLVTEDLSEGIRAFNEKRKPEFMGK